MTPLPPYEHLAERVRWWYWDHLAEPLRDLRERPRCLVGLHYGGMVWHSYGYDEPGEYSYGCVECENEDWQPKRWRVMERIWETGPMQAYVARMYRDSDDGLTVERVGWRAFLRGLFR